MEAPALKEWMKTALQDISAPEIFASAADLAPTLVLSAVNGAILPVSKIVS